LAKKTSIKNTADKSLQNFSANQDAFHPGFHEYSSSSVKNIQPKLTVGAPNDPYEKEADAVADKVMRMPGQNFVQRKCAECEKEEEEKLHRKALSDSITPFIQTKSNRETSVPDSVSSSVQKSKGNGSSLDSNTQSFMESRFGADFGSVKIHTGSESIQMNRELNAKAFTSGSDIYFNEGQFQPHSSDGKQLLAHELTHTLHQGGTSSNILPVQKKCDVVGIASRVKPFFFPLEKDILEVFAGTATIKKGEWKPLAIGVIQQALVDLKIDLGKSGPAKNGVDRDFGDSMVKGVKKFQNTQGIPETGEINKDSLRCVDIERTGLGPVISSLPLAAMDVEVNNESISSDQNIFFERGKAVLDAFDDKIAIETFVKSKVKPTDKVTPQGFISDDEMMAFGPKLGEDRAKVVSVALNAEKIKAKAAFDINPPVNKAEEGLGVLDYPTSRKVHMEITGTKAAGASCSLIPKDWTEKDVGPCDKGDLPGRKTADVDPALKEASEMMKNAHDGLLKKDVTAKSHVKTWFGSEGFLATVTSKIKTWRDHVDKVLPAKNRCANTCHAICSDTLAYNANTGADAMMTICDSFFDASQTKTERARTLIHEAGHGAIDTSDIAYDHTRLISLLDSDPSLALKNTDSYAFLIDCFNAAKGLSCAKPVFTDDFSDLPDPDHIKKAKKSLAWLERWTDWVWQDMNNLYEKVKKSREEGKWPKDPKDPDAYDYTEDLKRLYSAFGISRRPSTNSPATMGEQIFIGSLNKRFTDFKDFTMKGNNIEFILDETATLTPEWEIPPANKITVHEPFFKLADRAQVRFLLQLLAKAHTGISKDMEDSYVKFIEEDAKTWFDKP